MQRQTSLEEKIVASLILLKRDYGLTLREIAHRLGMNENYLSGVSGGKRNGSHRLLLFLECLIALSELKKHAPLLPWPEPKLREQAMQRATACGLTLEQFVMWCAILHGSETADDIITRRTELPIGASFNSDETRPRVSGAEKEVILAKKRHLKASKTRQQ